MLRAALPRPQHKGLATRRAEAHHNRPQRAQPTAWQRLHPANAPKKRSPGTLERWDKAIRRSVTPAGQPLPIGQQKSPLLLLRSGSAAPQQLLPAPVGRPALLPPPSVQQQHQEASTAAVQSECVSAAAVLVASGTRVGQTSGALLATESGRGETAPIRSMYTRVSPVPQPAASASTPSSASAAVASGAKGMSRRS